MNTGFSTHAPSQPETITIIYLSAIGQLQPGAGNTVSVPKGLRLSEFIAKALPETPPSQLFIRVNNANRAADYVLQENDTVAVASAALKAS